MTWLYAIRLIEYSMMIWFGCIIVAIARRMMRGEMVLSGMLMSERGSGLAFHRLQNLAITLLFAAGYLIRSLSQVPEQGLPDVPAILLAPLMGSQGVYLAGKYLRGARGGRG